MIIGKGLARKAGHNASKAGHNAGKAGQTLLVLTKQHHAPFFFKIK